jgi:adenylate kinase
MGQSSGEDMIALLTGAPGVGKTSVARLLAERSQGRIVASSFGELLHQSVERRLGRQIHYSEFRRSSAKLVQASDIEVTTEAIVAHTQTRRPDGWLLVDSHAVATTDFGWRANPDTPQTLRKFAYRRIIHLVAPAGTVLDRTRDHPSGRLAVTEREVEVLAAVQLAISAYYASILGCPLDVVDAMREMKNIVETIAGLLDVG